MSAYKLEILYQNKNEMESRLLGLHLGFDFPVEEENTRGIFLVWEGEE